MPIHLNTQDSGPESKYAPISGSGAEKVKLPPTLAVSLRYNVAEQGAEWEYNLHDLDGWQTCPDQTNYRPPICVTRVLINDASNTVRSIHIDLAGNGWTSAAVDKNQQQLGITLSLLTNMEHEVHITKIYLNDRGLTNFTQLVFLG